MTIFQIESLTKNYNSITALNDISLEIGEGEILGVLGPNGAGKTTLFRLLTGSLTADGGSVRPSNGSWPLIGYKPERLFFPEQMRVSQYLRTMASLSNIPTLQMNDAVRDVLIRANLVEAENKKIRELSKGMRQRLGLAQALIGDPDILILDEPTDGLDPLGQAEIITCIQELHQSGKTIVMSSHQLNEIVSVCTEIIILDRGQLIYQNSLEDALQEHPRALIYVDKDLEPIKGLLSTLHGEISAEGQVVGLREEALGLRRQILSILLEAGFDIVQIDRRQATLSEIYSEVTQ